MMGRSSPEDTESGGAADAVADAPEPLAQEVARRARKGGIAALFLMVISALLLLARIAHAQSPAELRAGVEDILEISELESVTTGMAESFTARVVALAGDLSAEQDGRLRASVSEAFTAANLRADVADFMSVEARDGMVTRVLEWLRGGANAEINVIEDGYDPPRSLEEYLAGLETATPPRARIALMGRWAAAQSAGDFSIILDEAGREAAYEVLRALRGEAPDFEELSRREYQQAHDRYTQGAVQSFLYRLEPVPDRLLERAIAEYESESGQWYVETYTFGIAEAVWLAGQRAARRLAGGVW